MTQRSNGRDRNAGRRPPANSRGGRRTSPPARRSRRPAPDLEETHIWRSGDPIQVSPAHFWDEDRQRPADRRRVPTGKAKRKKKRGKSRWPVVLGALLVVVLALFAVYRSWAQAPELPGAAEDRFDGTSPGMTGQDRKEGFYTFLIVGRDTGGGGNTDTLMLAAYDTRNQQAALMSIPRDTLVNVSWDVKKINSVYNMYLGRGKEEAIQALEDTVAGLIGFYPDYTVTVEWEAVGDIVNAIGGVYFEVPFYMSYVDPTQDLYIDQPPGWRLLTGADAMQVVRWRKNNTGIPSGTDGSDLNRVKVQQAFMMATLKQCLQLQNIPKIKEIAQVFTQRVETKLTPGNLVWFAEQAVLGGFSAEELYTCTLPCAAASVYSSSYKTNLSYVAPQGAALLEEINGHFNPFERDVTMDNLDLMVLNGSGGAYATGGTPMR